MWTRTATNGILPRHTCSARCRARRRYETWQLRSAPCLSQSTNRSSRTQCVLATPKSRTTRDGLWICGQRKGVAHIPTGPTTTATSFNLINLKNSQPDRKVLSQHGDRDGQQTRYTSFTRVLKTIHTSRTWMEDCPGRTTLSGVLLKQDAGDRHRNRICRKRRLRRASPRSPGPARGRPLRDRVGVRARPAGEWAGPARDEHRIGTAPRGVRTIRHQPSSRGARSFLDEVCSGPNSIPSDLIGSMETIH